MTTAVYLDVLDIVFHLSTGGVAQADDSARFATFYKGHVVKNRRFRSERKHSQFVVFETVVNPNQGSIPVELFCESQRNTVSSTVCFVLRWIKLNGNALM